MLHQTIETRDTRERILDAAESVVAERGVAALSLEATAAAAGVSKGGLLHHFRSKEALLTALVERMVAEMRAGYDAFVSAEAEGPGRHARACIAWALRPSPQQRSRDLRLAAALLSAHAHDPGLIEPVRREHARIRAAIANDGLPPGQAHAVLAAADGIFLAKVFGLWSPDETLAREIEAALACLARPC